MLFTLEKFILIYYPLGLRVKSISSRNFQVQNITNFAFSIIIGIFVSSVLINLHFIWTADLEGPQCLSFPPYSFFSRSVGPILTAVLNNYIPFFLLLLFNMFICKRLSESSQRIEKGTKKNKKTTSKGQNKDKKYLTVLLVLITFSFIVLTGPTQTLNTIIFAKPEFYKEPFIIFLRSLFTVFSKLYYTIGLYFYLVINKRFRVKFKFIIENIILFILWPCRN